MEIDVLGWYSKNNVGDEAFKEAFAEGFRLAGKSPTLKFYTEGFPAERRTLILGGGDVIRPFYMERIPPGCRVFPIGVGLGYASEIKLLRNIDIPQALFRNRADVDLARAEGINATYCPDLTYVLPDPVPVQIESDRKKLCVLLTDEVTPTFENRDAKFHSYYEYFRWEVSHILDELSEFYSIHLIPFSTLNSIDDRRIHHDVFRRMARRGTTMLHDKPLSVSEARSLIAGFDLMITMKFHGVMFAVQAGIPFINIAESRKTQIFCEENNLSQLSVPPYSLALERFMRVVKYAESEEARDAVKAAKSNLVAQARHVLPTVLNVVSFEATTASGDHI